jgi:hypothetical protein
VWPHTPNLHMWHASSTVAYRTVSVGSRAHARVNVRVHVRASSHAAAPVVSKKGERRNAGVRPLSLQPLHGGAVG